MNDGKELETDMTDQGKTEQGISRPGKPPLIVIAGPTASGKSELAAELGRRIGGEVVSADSMQVYRYMDIGSAKVTLEEMLGVPHHMIDVVDPKEAMDVARYAEMATACIRDILRRGKLPILCGGTGFYIQAVTRQIDFEDTEADSGRRKELERLAEEKGNDFLHEMLARIDPVSAEAIHPNNRKRTIRAIEYYEETGTRISDHNEREKERESPYDLAFFVISDDRKVLYDRIDRRVDFMMEAGLADEVRYLRAMGLTKQDVSMQGIGYKEILSALDGEMSLDEAVRIIKRDSRRYAKRQITWFKREKDAIWLDRRDFGEDTFRILSEIMRVLAHKNIIPANENITIQRPLET